MTQAQGFAPSFWFSEDTMGERPLHCFLLPKW